MTPTATFVQRVRAVLRKPGRRPYSDGLDEVIVGLTDVRAASLDFSDKVEQQEGRSSYVSIGLPGEAIDSILLKLESARQYRNHLLTYRAR